MKHKHNINTLVILVSIFLVLPSIVFATHSAEHDLAAERGPLTYTIITGLMVIVIVGAIYNLWRTTRAYGGIIGNGLRRIGVGSLILVIVALDRLALNFKVGLISGLVLEKYQSIVHDILLIAALFFILVGYNKLLSVTKN